MPTKAVSIPSYRKLVSDITGLYESARKALVEAYWKIGQRIVEVEQEGSVKAAYGSGLLKKLSEDLTEQLGPGFSKKNIERMRAFYLANPKTSTSTQLSWSQHVELLPVKDAGQRKRLIQKAVRDDLDCKAIRRLVGQELVREQVAANLKGLAPRDSSLAASGSSNPESLVPSPDLLTPPKLGPFYTYQIRAAEDVCWPEKGVLLLDRGFRSYCPLTPAESRGLKAGDIVEWTGTKLRKLSVPRSTIHAPRKLNVARGPGDAALLYGSGRVVLNSPGSTRATEPGYTYKAYLQKVIDGDTLWVVMDTGVRNVMRMKLRLQGIDCPEIDTVEGNAAKKFVENLLRDIPSLTILSSQNATYDRFEADVFFTDKTGQEVYLNNLLLEKGYAVRAKE